MRKYCWPDPALARPLRQDADLLVEREREREREEWEPWWRDERQSRIGYNIVTNSHPIIEKTHNGFVSRHFLVDFPGNCLYFSWPGQLSNEIYYRGELVGLEGGQRVSKCPSVSGLTLLSLHDAVDVWFQLTARLQSRQRLLLDDRAAMAI